MYKEISYMYNNILSIIKRFDNLIDLIYICSFGLNGYVY